MNWTSLLRITVCLWSLSATTWAHETDHHLPARLGTPPPSTLEPGSLLDPDPPPAPETDSPPEPTTRSALTAMSVFGTANEMPPLVLFNDQQGMTLSSLEPPVPFAWYPPAAGMGGFPPVPKIIEHGNSLHEAIEQNLTVRLRSGGILRPYGYARGDLDFASHLFNNIQSPFFVLPGDSSYLLPGATQPVDPNQTNYSLYARLTRVGLEYYSLPVKSLDGALASARTEIDFLTSTPANPESRPLLRLRLAYGQLTYGDWTFLVGQDWDLASPLIPSINDNTLQWNNGNTGDRRPQVKALWDHDFGDGYRLQVQNGLALLNAINSLDQDRDGIRDNEYSGVPGYEGRIGFVAPSWVEGKRMLGGFWGVWGLQKTSTPVNGLNSWETWAYGTDLQVPLTSWLTFRSEFFHGANLDDFRGGIAQGINPVTGQTISTTGGWLELVTQPVPWYQTSFGYSVDDPRNADVPQGGRTLNHSLYMGNRLLLGRGIIVGVDMQRWATEWRGLETGKAFLFKTFAQIAY
ncbi:hypothetical protein [Planctomicrobium sp. SH664]|uniref:hypothetical protein n=1 Tax=Planctomicrobium sp. SH664 TaxID=3448125 RepID=UPI003F5C5189